LVPFLKLVRSTKGEGYTDKLNDLSSQEGFCTYGWSYLVNEKLVARRDKTNLLIDSYVI